MKYQIFRVMTPLLLSLLFFGYPVYPASPASAKEALEENLKEFIVGVQEKIEQTEPVFRDDIFQQWARLVFGIRHITYIVDTRDPEKTLGVVTFMCKVTQSDFFPTKEEAEQAPIKNMIPKLIACRTIYQWKAGSWEYASGATYVRGGEWQPITTDRPDAFPQLYFDLMKGPSDQKDSLPNQQEQQEQQGQETTQKRSSAESIAEASAP